MKTGWRCGDAVEQAPLLYNWCGLDDVYLLSGFARTVGDDGEEEIAIQNLDGLHAAIAKHLAENKKALTGKEFRFIRKQMNISQEDLAEILGVNGQTVARWEKDEFDIPGPAELLFRVIYLSEILEKVDPRVLAAHLREADSFPTEKQVFQSTGDGWQALAA